MLEVISPGIYSSIQDLGRFGFRKFGVPQSGAMDQYASVLANQIIGNNGEEAVLEMTMKGPRLSCLMPCTVVVTGAPIGIKVNAAVHNLYDIISLEAGDIIELGFVRKGLRSYLAIQGGFQSDLVLGSRSYTENITARTTILKGEILQGTAGKNLRRTIKTATIKPQIRDYSDPVCKVLPGPEFEILSSTQRSDLLNKLFTVSSETNRMGCRLKEHLEGGVPEIITSPVMPGTVQLTPSGQLIILGRDAQTTGGYARVLQLTNVAQNIVAQKAFGMPVKFEFQAALYASI